jgi:acyl carrier protein
MRKIDNEIVDFMIKFFKQKKINKNSNINDIKKWDSLNHVNLIHLISKKYSIEISFNEMININSVKDVIKIVKKKLQPTRPLP